MICPLLSIADNCQVACQREDCQAWEAKAKFNPKTKKYEGDCRLFMLERKISGGISTHPY